MKSRTTIQPRRANLNSQSPATILLIPCRAGRLLQTFSPLSLRSGCWSRLLIMTRRFHRTRMVLDNLLIRRHRRNLLMRQHRDKLPTGPHRELRWNVSMSAFWTSLNGTGRRGQDLASRGYHTYQGHSFKCLGHKIAIFTRSISMLHTVDLPVFSSDSIRYGCAP